MINVDQRKQDFYGFKFRVFLIFLPLVGLWMV